jgi:hypothetical protein
MSNPHPPHNHFFVDGKKYDTDQTTLTGQQIKTIANVPANYQLFVEGHGNDPDQAISDGQALDVGPPPKHLYAVPPATFGAQ